MPKKFNTLAEIIIEQIRTNGPISVGEYMNLCLSHSEFGYYRRKDPFGIKGDFTTAPEISQMFGEMIGLWVADMWMKLGSPQNFILCECGPGRGTLMRDILRAFEIVPGLRDAVHIHLVETSPLLIEKQKATLTTFSVAWHESLATLPNDASIVFIGNEFFDALPLEQAMWTGKEWRQRCINEKFEFVLGEIVESDFVIARPKQIYEYAPVRDAIWSEICGRVKTQRGAALMIDYGFVRNSAGDTSQSVKNHKCVPVFETPGETDLSSLVNFARLKERAEGLSVYGPVTQGEFLKSLSIEVRAEKLAEYNPDKSDNIKADLKRLIDRDEMGELFKVIYVSNT